MMDDFGRFLEQLGDLATPLSLSHLQLLSDLPAQRLAQFHEAFAAFPVERRRRITRSLLELAEESFELDFGAVFRHCLDDRDATVRATAVEGLSEDTSPGLIGPLLRFLRSDPSHRVRAAAASGLGRFVLAGQLEELEAPVEARILSELLTTFTLEGEALDVQRRALESAAYAGSPEVLEALELAYDHDQEEMRLSAVLGMGRSCDLRWRPILLQELRSDSAAMRYEAILACGELGLLDSVPLLGERLHDSDRQIVEAALWALGQIGGNAARHLLLDAYEGADEDLEAAIDEALAEEALAAGTSDLMLYELDDLEDHDWIEEATGPTGDILDEEDPPDTGLDE